MLKGAVTGAWSSFMVVYGVRINLENYVTCYIAGPLAKSLLYHDRTRVPVLFSTPHVGFNRLAVTLTEAMQIIHNCTMIPKGVLTT